MNENVSDADLERYLRRRERVSSEYAALGGEQPAPELDALVLERARTALSEDAGWATWRRRRWPGITALAATVVLSFAVIVRIALENGQSSLISTTSPTTIPSATIPTSAPAATPVPTTAANAEADEEGYAEPPAALADRARADVPAVPQSTAGLPRAAIEAQIRAATERAPLASPPAAATKTRVAPLGRAVESKKREALQPSQPGLMQQERRESEQAQDPQSAVAKPARPPQAARSQEGTAQEETTQEETTMYRAGPQEHAAATSQEPDQASSVKASDVTATGARVSAPAAADEADRLRDPRAWLEEIEHLRAAGRDKEAAREMERFLKTYPDYPRPAEADTVRPASRTPTK